MIPPALQHFVAPAKVLDQGFVRLVDVMGDDGSVVTAARVTTGKGRSVHVWTAEVEGAPGLAQHSASCKVCGVDAFDSGPCIEGDRRFLRFMMRERHTSPFEFAEIVLHLRLPMDVWRQMVRHRTASVQEYSTRYSEAINAVARTESDAWRAQSGSNRQGSDGRVTDFPPGFAPPSGSGFSRHEAMFADAQNGGRYLTYREHELHDHAREVYEERLAFGVAKEHARKDLPLSNYTEVYWKCDLHNLMHFLSLRLDAHAQEEIRDYAQAIAEIVKVWVPLTWEAFTDYRLRARTFSRMDLELVRRMAAYVEAHERALAKGEGRVYDLSAFWGAIVEDPTVTTEPANQMSSRERADFLAVLGVSGQ